MKVSQSRRPKGFTLVELLVVLLIIGLVSAATLPVVLPALAHRQVSESARILQASIEGARDSAIRANAPRGIRLVPDPTIPGSATTLNVMLASNRIVPIEPAPDYTEGKVSIFPSLAHPSTVLYPIPTPPDTTPTVPYPVGALRIEESRYDNLGLPNARTSWFWNIRVGDRIRIGESGRLYTVVGPMVTLPAAGNPEQFVNIGPPGTTSPIVRSYVTTTGNVDADVEFLYLVNGQDDNQNGFVDEGWDGANNDGVNGVDNLVEWEQEAWVGPQAAGVTFSQPYTIKRRPVPTQGARVIEMPSNVVIDLTTWDSLTPERSRLPVDPNALTVEIMVSPNGTVIPTTVYSSPTSAGTLPFYHFWLAERTDVLEPLLAAAPNTMNRLPVPQGTPVPAKATAPDRHLKGDRRLVTLFTRSGMVVTNEVESFSQEDINQPYYDAQLGTREAK